ncbi:MAG: penicillin-binding transpeptidase domain-containing protein [Acidobacteriota bacterium]|nr:penicillin-binding transpeptidase domain-containing protein [Blastocatellia bacterium]MDW8412268.1 penicillin-binding transpeptidase domain-containing protein [Acidobacteriota bacterium]
MFRNAIQNLRLLKRRTLVIALCFVFWAAGIVSRLVHFQVTRHAEMSRMAERQQHRTVKLAARRGSIVDRNGNELAVSLEVDSIYAAPEEVPLAEVDRMAAELAKVLGLDATVVKSRLCSDKVLVSIKRKVSDQEAANVKALGFRGIHFVKETKRFYPKGELAAYILGYTGIDEEGFSGIERQFGAQISGKPGYVIVEKDAHGRPFDRYEKQSELGRSLMLTIDEQIQFRTEKILNEAVSTMRAKGGVVIVLKPDTGEVLAMASTPGFDPNEPVKDPEEIRAKRRNRAVEDAYEPGSVFKLVTYAAAFESGLLRPDDLIDCQGGAIEVAGHVVRDGGSYGVLSVAKAVEVSSNVAAIKTGRRLGKDRLLNFVTRFGFGKPTGVGLPGEAPGYVGGMRRWSDAAFGALPLGYQIVVTPIQLAAAYAAVANGGEWVQPHLLKKIFAPTGEVVFEFEPLRRRCISRKTADMMKLVLEGVVLNGTAKKARLEGYTAAGKTGTSRKFDRAIGRYSNSRYFATFCGFAPVNKPEIVVLVMIDEPPLGMHHGGQAAAPVFKQVAEMALRMLAIPPDAVVAQAVELVAETYDDEAGAQLYLSGKVRSEDDDFESKLVVTTFSDGQEDGAIRMPDLRGRCIKTAILQCKELGIKLEFTGSNGQIVEQFPAPGAAIFPGESCQVVLRSTR